MALGNKIVIAQDPRGRQIEGKLSGALKPGTCVQLSAATEPVAGRYQWEVWDAGADGDQRLVAVLMENFRGDDATTAYVTLEQCRIYIPLPGDELNMLVENIAGTSDSFAIGDLLMVNDASGKLVATTGSPESEAFVVMETVAAITADTLVHCMFTGY